MVINTNIAANAAARTLSESTEKLSESLSRLSSGSKIVSPEIDAAGLAQSMKFDAQINRNHAVISNLNNAISMSQTQDGFLARAKKALDRMSEISVLAQDVTKTNTDRSNYSKEFVQLQNFLLEIGDAEFNGVDLFGDYHPLNDQNNPVTKEVTIDSDGNKIKLNAINYSGYAGVDNQGDDNPFWRTFAGIQQSFHTHDSDYMFTVSGGGNNAGGGVVMIGDTQVSAAMGVLSSASAASALSNIQTSIQNLADLRANVGANIQRLKFSVEQNTILNENLSSASSRIKDVDVAEESTKYARSSLLVQSGTVMLTQANILPKMALKLIG